MAWTIKFDRDAQRELDRLDPVIARRIVRFLLERVGKLEDPRKIGERLRGQLHLLWKYRVGDYRVLCSLQQDILVVLVLEIGHRSKIYNR